MSHTPIQISPRFCFSVSLLIPKLRFMTLLFKIAEPATAIKTSPPYTQMHVAIRMQSIACTRSTHKKPYSYCDAKNVHAG